jgi:hypothetical protein
MSALVGGGLAEAQSPPEGPVGGVHHFEVTVLGLDQQVHEANAAYAITDHGVVVGRVKDGGVPRAFVYALRDRTTDLGLGLGSFQLLPTSGSGGTVAYAANDAGVIVGAAGADDFSEFDFVRPGERAAVWRLVQSTGASVAVVAPPSLPDFVSYAQGGYGRFRSVAAGASPWAGGAFRSSINCGSSPFTPQRTAASAVRLQPSGPGAADYRWELADSARAEVRAISASATALAGVLENCPTWIRSARGWMIGDASSLIGFARHFDPDPSSATIGETLIDAVLGDGTAVGSGLDSWSSGHELALFWRPNADADGGLLPPEDIGGHGLKGSRAYAVASTAEWDCGLESGRFAVGRYRPEVAARGRVWFRPDSMGSNWSTDSWTYRDVNDLVSPIQSTVGSIVVTELFGVNRRGDMAGAATVTTPAGSRTVPVVLRAVPMRCVGDLNHDGTIGAPDLAILLGNWCPTGGTGCEPLADLNIDGVVDSQDLAEILNNWDSTCSCANLGDASEVPEALAVGARASLDFSIQYVGLVDVATYREWAAQVPQELRELFDRVIWSVANEGGIDQ